ncbi:helix-turn-helix domain-containing protein [Xanthobacter autotrophicus]|uniref:helix-turn-helix domain-containing protein n=1 Tax=Xanthobacter autotrophicus TaxID=280 RepID=UPI00372BE3B6
MDHAATTGFPPRASNTRLAGVPEPAAFDTSCAARYLGVGKTTLFAEIKAGRLEARKTGRRTVITRAALDAWLASLPTCSAV